MSDMIRVVYISGRYRHYRLDNSFDRPAMMAEVQREKEWAEVIARCGLAWLAPLHQTVMLEDVAPIGQDEYIDRDCAIIRRLRPNYDLILMREGWDDEPESVGATREHETAVKHGLIVIYGEQGTDKVAKYLRELE